MAKRTKKIQAKLTEVKDVHGKPLAVLKIGQRTLGEIQSTQSGSHRFWARSRHGRLFHINTLSDGLRDLLSEYHLHSR